MSEETLFFVISVVIIAVLSGLQAISLRSHSRYFIWLIVQAWGILTNASPLLYSILKVEVKSKLVSGGVFISSIAPLIGNQILRFEDRALFLRNIFDERIGEEMIEFRRSLRRIYVRKDEGSEDYQGKSVVLSQIKMTRNKIQRRHTIGELAIAVVGGIIAIFLSNISILAGLAVLVSVYLVLFPISMFVRGVIVDELSYPGEMVDEENERIKYEKNPSSLRFQLMWNRMLLKNERDVHKLILIGFLKGEFPLGYDIGKELIEKCVAEEVAFEHAFDEMVDEILGEDTRESRSLKKVFRQLFGLKS